MRNRAVDDTAYADFAEDRHTLDGALEPRSNAVQVVGEELVGGLPLRVALGRPGLREAAALIDPHQPGLLLLAQIPRGIRVADHWNLAAPFGERRNRVGDHVVMLHVRDGCIRAD